MNKFWGYFNSYKNEWLFVLALVVLCAIPRFVGLGFSHFYGDETKVLYLDKTVAANDFFLNQRKGPVQSLVAWSTEKLFGSYSELWTRLPYAIAGTLAVLLFYFLTRELYTARVAQIASLLFGLNGFFIAFARTVQYQSFLFLFGFSALFLIDLYKRTHQQHWLVLSGISYGLALLSHYDAIFFLLPGIVLLNTKELRHLLAFFTPLVLITLAFYLPYFLNGHFEANTQGYLSRRLTGVGQELPNDSFYTNSIYNPNIFYSLLLVSGLVAFIYYKKDYTKYAPVLVWFAMPLVVFTLIFKNPGTHIINFIIPTILLSSIAVEYFFDYEYGKRRQVRYVFAAVMLVQIAFSYLIFIPQFNTGYPWRATKLLGSVIPAATKESQLFLYGFPYNRNWQEIAQTLKDEGARGYYTNENIEIAQYYVGSLPITRPGSNFLPQYYVDVVDSQELNSTAPELLTNYVLVKDIYGSNNSVTAKVYRLK